MRFFSCFLILFLSVHSIAGSTTVVLTSPERNVRIAPLIIEADVLHISYEKSLKGIPFAVIKLRVKDRITGNSPEVIEIRRAFVTPSLKFLDSELIPTYHIGEKFIITLYPTKNGYSTLGLHNGKFIIQNGTIQNTNITVEQFKTQIRQVRNGLLASFPASLPRHGLEQGEKQKIVTGQEASKRMSCHEGEPHLGGEFRAWNFTWDISYLPVTMYYNPSNEPVSYTPSPDSIAQLAEIAYELWEDDTSFFTIQNADPQSFVTSEGSVDNNKSVILWEDLGDMDTAGEARMYPNTEEKIYDCQTMGRESNRAVDIVLNPIISKTWLFQENPPSQTYADFVGVLAHELGHGMGLAHVDITNSMMYPAPEAQGWRYFTDGDRAGLTYQHTISNLSGTIPYSMVLSASTDNFTIDGDLIVPESEILDITDSKTLTFSTPGQLTIDGESYIGNNFTLQDGAIEVGQTGSLEFLGDAD